MVGRPPSSSHAPLSPRKRLLNPARLAAALGLSGFIDSLQNHNRLRRHRQEGRAPKLNLAVSSAKWHTATSTQHVRGILQVCHRFSLVLAAAPLLIHICSFMLD